MNVKELKAKLSKLPDHMEVVISQTDDQFPINTIESAKVKLCSFSEEPGGPVLAKDKCLVLSDEI